MRQAVNRCNYENAEVLKFRWFSVFLFQSPLRAFVGEGAAGVRDLRAARGRDSSALPEAPRVRTAGAGANHGGGPAAEEEAGGGGREKWRGRH